MNWQSEFESLVSSIGSITYGKERWFYQGDDVWYDQDDGEYCSTYILHQKILDAIREKEMKTVLVIDRWEKENV